MTFASQKVATTPLLGAVASTVRKSGTATFVALGDSLTADPLPGSRKNWPTVLAASTDQAFRLIYNAGIGGQTTTQMLSRFQADVLAKAPTHVIIFGGANDFSANSTVSPMTQPQANIRAMVALARQNGIVPILCTLTPHTGFFPSLIARWNEWVKLYAHANRITLIDFAAVTTAASNGGWIQAPTRLDYDGLHPNDAGRDVMVTAAKAALTNAGLIGAAPSLLPTWGSTGDTDFNGILDNDGLNLVPNPLLLDTNADGVPDNWAINGGAPTGVTRSIVTDSRFAGNAYKLAFTTPTAGANPGIQIGFNRSNAGLGGFAPGDTLRFVCKYALDSVTALDDGASGLAPSISWSGGSSPFLVQHFAAGGAGTLLTDIVVPAGTTSGTLSMKCYLNASASGSAYFGQFGLYNLNALALL